MPSKTPEHLRIKKVCPCGTVMMLTPSALKTRTKGDPTKTVFCSQTCSHQYGSNGRVKKRLHQNPLEQVEQLVNDNMSLAKYFAHKWSVYLDFDEGLSIAMGALWNAANEWDSRVPFGSYASLRIRWAFLRDNYHKSAKRKGRQFFHLSIDDHVGDEGSATYGELIPDDRAVTAGDQTQAMELVDLTPLLLDGLKPLHRDVIERRFGLTGNEIETLEEIGRRHKLTRERIRQIETLVLKRLRTVIGRIDTTGQTEDCLGLRSNKKPVDRRTSPDLQLVT